MLKGLGGFTVGVLGVLKGFGGFYCRGFRGFCAPVKRSREVSGLLEVSIFKYS